MTNLLEALRNLGFPVAQIVQQPIVDSKGITIAWNFFVQDQTGISLAGGTHAESEIAKRISIAEAFERALARKIASDINTRKEYLMEEFPTSCGFACGFDSNSTKERAIREAVERWAWSKWIDSSFFMAPQGFERSPNSNLVQLLGSTFKNVRLFRKNNIVVNLGHEKTDYSFVVLILETDVGVFAGCRAGKGKEDLITHSLIEASRCYKNHLISQESNGLTTNSIVAKRASYFATNKEEAFRQIEKSQNLNWPGAEIRILKEFKTGIDGIYLWRCLMNDFVPWHLGNEMRFVY
ncbi:hypothetical protein [Bdellovibrio sp. HCB337]|uniref:hypothetical protein n=1 Tax=Bdellovibrio sp. HCB337 TaxID=3394358 RepID=UPI0039A61B43